MTLVAAALAVALIQDPPSKAEMDKPVADLKLRDVMQDAEKHVTLSEYRDKKVVVLFFVSYSCQVTWKYEERIGKVLADYGSKDVVFLGIRSSANDTADKTRKYCESKNFDMPVLYDDRNVVADYYGVTQTPVFMVIDRKGVLRYSGAFDEDMNAAAAKKPHLRNALDAVLEGKEVGTKTASGYG